MKAVRPAVATTLAACLLVSCSSDDTPARRAEPSRTWSASPSAPSSADDQERLGALPSVPASDDPAAMARDLDRAAATLGDGSATASDVRRAAEFQQLAIGTLATAPRAFRRQVLERLHAGTARVVRDDVTAARLLQGMTSPQKKLPRWRIVQPPPPGQLLRYYRQAQRRTGVPWTYLAAIHLVETRMGRIRGASTAGALGPMQFLPSTWDLYGEGGDINDPHDAILAAARLLRANGARPGSMAGALWHFNPSDSYVRAVSAYARTMQRSGSAFRGYWHWRVLFRSSRGTFVLPVGYPDVRPVLLPGR